MKAREAKAKADAELEAKSALAKVRLQEAKIEAEQKRIACSVRGSSIAASRQSRAGARRGSEISKRLSSKAELCVETRLKSSREKSVLPATTVNSGNYFDDCTKNRTKQWINDLDTRTNRVFEKNDNNTVPKSVIPTAPLTADQAHSAVHQYLERQGRNEYINLASQLAYNGNNIAFVFYENQIRKLMSESPHEERCLEVLRASCVGQPREMINLFFAPLKGMTTSQRIEKALDRLRQRYGVSGGVVSEPKVIEIRHGPKVTHTTASLKAFNEDLNTLEVFAYAHGQIEKLSGQLLLDTANRLSGNLKRRYLVDRSLINLNQPSLERFESLRKFIVHEIDLMTSDYAQAFFKSEDKDKTRDLGNGRGCRACSKNCVHDGE